MTDNACSFTTCCLPHSHSFLQGNLDPFDGLVTYRLVQEAGETGGMP